MKESTKQTAGAAPGVGAAIAPKGPTPPPTQMRGGDKFPNPAVVSHTGKKYRLYDDLVKDRVVMINYMSIKGHKGFPVTEHMARVAKALGKKLGREVFMYSITTDPGHDTPQRLKAFAEKHGARPGWSFLTATPSSMKSVNARLRRHGHSHGTHGYPTRLVHYGNAKVGVWGAFGADSNPELAVTRLSWVRDGAAPKGAVKRAGPRKLAGNFSAHNREA